MAKNNYISGQPILCQVLSYLPKEIVDQVAQEYQSDRYYKTMTTYKQLVFLFYGVVMRCKSLNNLCKNLLLLENKLSYLGIMNLPASSTLSDANINRDSDVFAKIYQRLNDYYKDRLKPFYASFEDYLDIDKVFCFDSTTIGLFVDIFKGAGRNPIDGRKKGGLKLHTKMPITGFTPSLVCISEAACNDKIFLGQLETEKGAIYIFDKGYVNYSVWEKWTDEGCYYVTRLNENASYQVLEGKTNSVVEYANGGLISDQRILINNRLSARLIIYKDYTSDKVLKFVTNQFAFEWLTVVQLYKYRWNIEVLFKQLKQNFELSYFFSDSTEGVKTQIWIALIAQLIFTVIHRQIKEAEAFVTLVNVASNNMGAYVSLEKIIQVKRLTADERDISRVQLVLFDSDLGGVFSDRQNTS